MFATKELLKEFENSLQKLYKGESDESYELSVVVVPAIRKGKDIPVEEVQEKFHKDLLQGGYAEDTWWEDTPEMNRSWLKQLPDISYIKGEYLVMISWASRNKSEKPVDLRFTVQKLPGNQYSMPRRYYAKPIESLNTEAA